MLKTFSIGGVHPHENKLSAHQPIITAEVPAKAVILLGQHIGAPAKPVVAKGDMVKVGTKIAEPAGFVSAAIHSSVSGKVAKIDTVVDASGYAKPAIFIDVEGDEWEETIDRSKTLVKECEYSAEEIVKKIADAGIVGLGGACFPTQVIINAVECEPYLTADHQLMLEHAEEVMVGVSILMKAVKVNKAFIGIENNKPDAIELMTKVASSYAGIEVVPLKVKYPQGGEKQLIDAITKRQVASGALPISTGAVVQNVGTAFAVYEAVQKNKPLFERVITVTGKSVAKPSNFLARIGTPMKQLIDACGGLPEDTGKVIGGGPMMGKALVNIEVPTAKGSSGILIMNQKEAKRGEAQTCIRCAKCVSACPMGLEPYLLGALSENGDFETMEKERIMDCIECGSCQFTCPANRPLLDYCRLGKGKVGAMIRARQAKSPHVHGGDSVQKNMYGVLIALIPAFLVSLYFFGLGALIVTATSVAACLFFEWAIVKFLMKKPATTICDGSAVITGVLLAFNLPSNLPVWIIILGALFAIGVGKMSFGGLGCNPFNPALAGRVFLLLSFPVQMTTWPVVGQLTSYMDATTGATPLALMKQAIHGDTSALSQIPDALNLFIGQNGGCIGEVSALALLLGLAYMLWKKIITWHIPVSIIVTVFVFAGIMHLVDPEKYVSPVLQLLSGGLMLGAVFMATDYVTSPMSKKGMLIYGVCIGLLTVVIRLFGAYPEGMSFAILIMNAFTPLINTYCKPKRFGEVAKKK